MNLFDDALKIAIVGSRTRDCRDAVRELVYSLPANATIVSGGARGVDTYAVECAVERGMTVIEYRPRITPSMDYRAICAELFRRNGEIARAADICHAFPDADKFALATGGTYDAVQRFRRLGKPVEVH